MAAGLLQSQVGAGALSKMLGSVFKKRSRGQFGSRLGRTNPEGTKIPTQNPTPQLGVFQALIQQRRTQSQSQSQSQTQTPETAGDTLGAASFDTSSNLPPRRRLQGKRKRKGGANQIQEFSQGAFGPPT